LYGSETWVLTKREEILLFGLEKEALRRIYNPKKSRRCAHEHSIGQLNREFNSPVPKTHHRESRIEPCRKVDKTKGD
jgi:hypothetical protein